MLNLSKNNQILNIEVKNQLKSSNFRECLLKNKPKCRFWNYPIFRRGKVLIPKNCAGLASL